jgi:hypothetical protein
LTTQSGEFVQEEKRFPADLTNVLTLGTSAQTVSLVREHFALWERA